MASGIDIKVDPNDLKHVLDLMDPKQAQKTQVLVLNKLLSRAARLTKEAFTKRYNLKPSVIKIQQRRAKSQPNPAAYIWGRMRPYSLWRFRPEQIGTGVQVEIERGKTISLPGAFMEQPQGRNWKSRGQTKTKESQVPVVLKRMFETPYKLSGDTDLIKPEQQARLGEFIISPEHRLAIQQLINREAPILLQQTIDDQVKRRSAKLGIDADGE